MAEIIITGDGDELQVSATVGANTLIDGTTDAAAMPLALPWLVEAVGDSEYKFSEAGSATTGTAYATAAQYRDRSQSPASSDELVDDVLVAASRYLDRRLGWCPGGLGPLPEQTVTFWPSVYSRRVLRFRDAEGQAWPWRSITEIAVDYAGTGVPDKTWALVDESWIVPLPQGGPPWRSLRIHESARGATESAWPSDPGTVKITGAPGRDAVPHAVQELTIHVARAILDGHAGGAAAVIGALEAGVSVDREAAMLWRRMEMEFSAGRMGRLGVVASAAGRSW